MAHASSDGTTSASSNGQSARIAARDQAISVLSRHMTMDRFGFFLDLERSQGSHLVTLKGEHILDCYSAFASLPVGWNHPRLCEPSFVAKLGRIAVNKPALSDTFTVEMASMVETFYRVGIPSDMPWLFFIDGGGLAVENTLKAAFDWKVRKNLAAGRAEGGSKILHFAECFHGRTGYTMSLTDSHDPRKTLYFPKFDWPRVIPPYLSFPLTEASLADVQRREAESIAAIQRAFDEQPHEIAAIIVEPIQGEGGDHHFRSEFLAQLRDICDQREALLIFDEVQTGIGATGTFWCWQGLGVKPDLVSFGKKTQVCGMYAGERLNEVERNVFVEPSRINSTFGGNLVDIVRFQRVLEVIEEDKLVDNAAQVGAIFLEALEGLQDRFSDLISNTRGRGLFLALDLPDPETRNRLVGLCMDEGLFVLSCGASTLRLRPTLTFSENDVGEAIEKLSKALERATSQAS
ncbi:MAG: L-lysine 6-transaminase [Rickettsiales bacterium]|nr:L-lysine 6-transaminase [Rickettsiales bacterium]